MQSVSRELGELIARRYHVMRPGIAIQRSGSGYWLL